MLDACLALCMHIYGERDFSQQLNRRGYGGTGSQRSKDPPACLHCDSDQSKCMQETFTGELTAEQLKAQAKLRRAQTLPATWQVLASKAKRPVGTCHLPS